MSILPGFNGCLKRGGGTVSGGQSGNPVLSDWQADRRRQSLVPLGGSPVSGSVSVNTVIRRIIKPPVNGGRIVDIYGRRLQNSSYTTAPARNDSRLAQNVRMKSFREGPNALL